MRSSLCVSILLLSSIALAQSNKPTRPVTYSVHFKSVNFDTIQVEGAIDAQMSQLGLSKDDQRPDLRIDISVSFTPGIPLYPPLDGGVGSLAIWDGISVSVIDTRMDKVILRDGSSVPDASDTKLAAKQITLALKPLARKLKRYK
jgi:hypothetical protein